MKKQTQATTVETIKSDWEGETVAIVASGPSLSKSDVERLKGTCKVIVVNDNYKLAPWADILYAADRQWWEHHSYVKCFAGERWTQSIGTRSWPGDAAKHGLKVVKGARVEKELSTSHDTINTGRHSGFQALNIAYLKGAERILLLGYDYANMSGKKHWFGDHPGALNRVSPYALFRESVTSVADFLGNAGVEVINCSTFSTLSCFQRKRVENCLHTKKQKVAQNADVVNGLDTHHFL